MRKISLVSVLYIDTDNHYKSAAFLVNTPEIADENMVIERTYDLLPENCDRIIETIISWVDDQTIETIGLIALGKGLI